MKSILYLFGGLFSFLIFGYYFQTSNFINFSIIHSGQTDQCSEAPPTLGQFFKAGCQESYIKQGDPVKGPWAYLRASKDPRREINSIKKLVIVEQNFENLGRFIEIQKNQNNEIKEIIREKSEEDKLTLAIRLKKQNPDIIIAAEVKDIETATDFANKYLDGLYQPLLIEGNDQRGIDICYFIKKDLPFDIGLQSHKNTLMSNPDQGVLFSRDLPVLLIREAGSNTESAPLMIIAGVHYKAQMPDPKKDKKATERRAQQVQGSVEIIKWYKNKFPKTPVFISGDFNNDIRNSPEFSPFFVNQYKDAMDISKDSPPKERRGTQYFFFSPEQRPPQTNLLSNEQLDAVLVDPVGQEYILSAGIQRDVDINGNETPFPKNAQDVNDRASDHDGVYIVIDFEKLLLDHKKLAL